MINATPEIKKLYEDNDNKLPKYAWPGGYPIFYLDKDNCVVCPSCANEGDEEAEEIVGYAIHWEGLPISCESCNVDIESAYGPCPEDC